MARQKQAKPAKDDAADSSLGFTPERFERELKDLAAKAKSDTRANRLLGQATLYVKTAVLLTLLGVYSNASQLALSPVYGSVPAAAWHSRALMAGCFVGWAGNLALRQLLPVKTAKLLPLVALYVPVMQCFLYRFSQALGPSYGPLVTEGVTLVPLAILTASCVADNLEDVDLSSLPKGLGDAVPGIGSWGTFKLVEHVAEKLLQKHVGTVFWYTRMGLEILLAGSYAVFAPSKWLALAIPALVHTAMFNPHVATPAATALLNTTMAADHWLLLDRRESVTGYISVAENTQTKMRVMRADHSLLGGDWVEWRGNQVTEPIYAVFVNLEAIRLVERERPVADSKAKALVIGLGIGTMPSALVSHGIETTVVEIDPAVYDFAQKYFQLRENRPPVIEDAVKYANKAANETKEVYDYIVHDVFTGGVEPVALFTYEFLNNLYTLLKPDGVIAINYAGDLMLPTSKTIVRTIMKNFPTCRLFRENPPDKRAVAETGTDFTNLIIFCRKVDKLTFRDPVPGDYLNSPSRQSFLTPQHEISPRDLFAIGKDEEGSVLYRNGTDKASEGQQANAAGHWAVMRTALPARFWENW
ncbi:S-adenosyl-L-methionine-dependent methyltransferase [Trichoderma citrinoviride]|uniref:S-adenosyl-L-methionine-dependent methyltransferase n=1 Tax=Trichoderma citrinoviride TaxID=58853 RepID=A0A2T4B5J1_9HYPO|nr:S-adenosyl-L-methionine-dependent methyltransferase [Trichoderma citrinoviride]PTB64607.1 S-adenosyl-L-methionine-dependent methyltransferase [Trichoderma citrinoviride]